MTEALMCPWLAVMVLNGQELQQGPRQNTQSRKAVEGLLAA